MKRTLLFLSLTILSFQSLAFAEIIHVEEVGSCDTPGAANSVYLNGNYAYVADQNGGLRIINTSNSAAPFESGSYTINAYALDVAVNGNYAYVAAHSKGLRIINISTPSAPTQTGYYDTASYADGIAVSGNYAYVADVSDGLRIINIGTPNSPTEVGYYDTPGSCRNVAVTGSYVYVADGGGGLRIINIATPAAPSEVGYYDTPGFALGVVVNGNYAYVADSYGGLRIINVSIPGSPSETGFYSTSDFAYNVAVNGNYAYVACGMGGLQIINISNPASPYMAGYYVTPLVNQISGAVMDVMISGNNAYIADNNAGGLRILRFYPATATATPTVSPTSTPTATPTSTPTFTPTPIPPVVSFMEPHHSLISTRITFEARGKYFGDISKIRLRNLNQTIMGTSLILSGNSLTAVFDMPVTAGFFDLILSKGALDYIFKTIFTLLFPLSEPLQWQIVDLGKAGNPSVSGPSSIVIADADRDSQSELYVADNDRMIFQYKKNVDWNAGYFLETASENFQNLLAIDGNRDRDWELYTASSQLNTYQLLWNGTCQSNTISAYGGFMVAGDGNQDGFNEIYIAGNSTTGRSLVQCSFNNSTWTTNTIEGTGYAFTSVVAGDGDNDRADEVYVANHDHYLYQYKYTGNSWQRSVVYNVGNGITKSMAIADLDHDGANELYAANQDGKIYQINLKGSWISTNFNVNNSVCNQIVVSDGDNDGQEEIYGAGEDGHAYRYKFDGSAWQVTDLGNAGTPLYAIAVGDGDNNYQFEVYSVGSNGHVYQFYASTAALTYTPTPSPTITPTPQATSTPLAIPAGFQGEMIDQRYFYVAPNPTKSANVIFHFFLIQSAEVEIRIYTPQGSHVLTKSSKFYPQGWNTVIWNASGMANGVYFYIAEAKSNGNTKRIKKNLCLIK